MRFKITEDDLTNAIFCKSSLDNTGAGTMAEARVQARRMLAVEEMLAELVHFNRIYDRDNVPSRREVRPSGSGVLVSVSDPTAARVKELLRRLSASPVPAVPFPIGDLPLNVKLLSVETGDGKADAEFADRIGSVGVIQRLSHAEARYASGASWVVDMPIRKTYKGDGRVMLYTTKDVIWTFEVL